MKQCRADLHLHIGRAGDGRPIKIPSSPALTVEGILAEAKRKGLDLVGIVDAHFPAVRQDVESLIRSDRLEPLTGGGYKASNGVVILTGVEMETWKGRFHQVAFFPTLEQLGDFARRLLTLGSGRWSSPQRVAAEPSKILSETLSRQGFFFFAHVFTPYRGLYSAGLLRNFLTEGEREQLAAVELGLSADSPMADHLAELAPYTFLSNSDAHSLGKLAREFNVLRLAEASFQEVEMALLRRQGRRVDANFGLDPRLGKYHRTYCPNCDHLALSAPPVLTCPECGNQVVVLGVMDRLIHLAGRRESQPPPHRPPYHYQIPLEYLPGIGLRAKDALLQNFGSEINALHQATASELERVLGPKKTGLILSARRGELPLLPGGGGRYGRVKLDGKLL
ncbi:MAG: endonuclease Q family protein [Firmicutes bacterium]|nr:endonuclease Q family protein [Bacillota bacterium]MCL5038689.1 endonuclease Q family protein [Bacillota bacterium]